MSDAPSRAEEQLDPREHRVLGGAVVKLWDWSNVAYPCPGYWAHSLHRRGLMSLDVAWIGNERVSTYTVTPAGRRAYLSYGRPLVPVCQDALEPA